ncbi:MAG: EAL domain-containing protein [Alphaproteobacteria bacterium]|nr:EAL domain-containing protein [Alphaproteobacteria bacterium]
MNRAMSEDRILAALMDTLNVGVIVVDITGKIVRINQVALKITGATAAPERLGPAVQAVQLARESGEPLSFEDGPMARALRGEEPEGELIHVTWPDGRRATLLVEARPIRAELGQVVGALTTFEDLTEKEALRRQVRSEEYRYRALTELVSDYTYELAVDEDNRLTPVWVTDAFEGITGYALEELIALGGLRVLVLPADHGVLRRQFKACMTGQEFTCEVRIRTKRDEVRWMRSFTRPIIDPTEGRVVRVIGAARDISDEKLLSPLTGLPNLTAYRDRVAVALDRLERRPGMMLAVAYIDFDHFHVVNQSFGYPAGDALLRIHGDRLTKFARPGDSAAHLRGDEFSMLFTDLRYPDEALALAEKLLARIAEPAELEGTNVVLTASMGLAFAEDDGANPDDLLRCAQTAASRARALGGGRFEVYDPEMMHAMRERLRLESALRRAIQGGELRVHYQPIVDLRSGVLSGFEALVRWTDPHYGPVSPDSFIAVAEETGLIIGLGEYVLQQACARLADWYRAFPGLPALSISVNLSPVQVIQGELLFRLDRALRQTGLAPSRLRLEITESTLMRDPDAAIELLEQVRERGVRVGVDDFGTGHSSLSLLHRFPVDSLKVDRAFVHELGESEHADGIVSTIVALARHMRLELIAEGVETEDQARSLLELGVQLGQGYLFSKAVPGETADKMVEALANGAPLSAISEV